MWFRLGLPPPAGRAMASEKSSWLGIAKIPFARRPCARRFPREAVRKPALRFAAEWASAGLLQIAPRKSS
jgi:hypothetical protein